MIQYDPSIIQSFANGLYAQADELERSHAFSYGVIGCLLGGLGGYFFGVAIIDDWGAFLALPVAVAAAAAMAKHGVEVGRRKGFGLRLRAQTALCQVQIELNGRPRQPTHASAHAQPR